MVVGGSTSGSLEGHHVSCEILWREIFTCRKYYSFGGVRVLGLFLRVTSSCTIPTYSPTRPSRRNYFGFRHATMASSGVGLYHGLWWSYAHDPAYRRDPDTMGDAAIC